MTEPTSVLLHNVGVPDSYEIETYMQRGGYQALEKVLKAHPPAEVIQIVSDSGLRGRGGAGFPAGRKWMFLPKGVYPRYLVCNADEGEPGTFKDRLLIEHDPHGVIEGIILASYACEVEHAFIYIRGEYELGHRRLRRAVDQALARGYLGRQILGTGYSLNVSIVRGAGAYICGEETAMLSSLEGARGQPKLKPPFPAAEGLYRKPTVINNVETLFNVPFIVARGAAWYRQWGTERSPGLKLYCVSGHVKRPGTYEMPMDATVRELLYDVCGGPKDDIPLKAVFPGGSSTNILPAGVALQCRLDYESIAEAGSMLGSGAMIFLNEQTCIVRTIQRLEAFYRHESCGKCIPCREGTDWIYRIVRRVEEGQGRPEDPDLLLDICDNMAGNCFCPLGDAAVAPVQSSVQRFREEYEFHIREKRCMNGPPTPLPLAAGPEAKVAGVRPQ